jgi:hypothetical protein
MGISPFMPDREQTAPQFTLEDDEQWKAIGANKFIPLSQAAPDLGALQAVVICIRLE